MINISGEKILIADEDRRFRQLISSNLKSLGYDVIEADNGDDALKKAIYLQPDLLLIDLLSPEINGLEVCKDIRSTKDVAYMPIIILTAISDEFDIVLGLELGADDLIKKPFSMRELYARVKAVLRRSDFKPIHNVVVIKDLVVNFEKYQVTKTGKKVDFTLKEFEVLELLIKVAQSH